MADTRYKNALWVIRTSSDGTLCHSSAQIAVLMDIRDELQTLNSTLSCPNFLAIPAKLDAIRRNTSKRRSTKGGMK